MANLIVRADGDPLQMVEQVKRAIARVDPTQAVSQVRTMAQVAEQSTARPRLRAQSVVAFAVLATLLAAVGIFSVLMFMVQRGPRVQRPAGRGSDAVNLLRLALVGGLSLCPRSGDCIACVCCAGAIARDAIASRAPLSR